MIIFSDNILKRIGSIYKRNWKLSSFCLNKKIFRADFVWIRGMYGYKFGKDSAYL
jgi:hypothetical protein